MSLRNALSWQQRQRNALTGERAILGGYKGGNYMGGNLMGTGRPWIHTKENEFHWYCRGCRSSNIGKC